MSYNPKSGYGYDKNVAKGGYGKKKLKGYKYSGAKPQKRKGYDDSARYEDGGVVQSLAEQARIQALKNLEQDMAELGSESLFQKFEEGGIVKSQEDFEESYREDNDSFDYDELSKSELIELLRNRR